MLPPAADGALVVVGGPCALLSAVVLRNSGRCSVLVFEQPAAAAADTCVLLPPRALALLARAAPDAAAALHQRGVRVAAPRGAPAADAASIAVSSNVLRRTLLDALPPNAHAAGRLTGLQQARTCQQLGAAHPG
jgi:hypothetical protein